MKFIGFPGFLWYNQLMKNTDNLSLAQAENAALKSKISELEALVKWYEEQLRLSKHRQHGKSSEKTELPGQFSLFNEAEVVADKKAPEPGFEEVAGHKRKKRVGKRDEMYKDLPTEQIIHELPEHERICLECGNDIHACGHEVLRREIEVIPAQVKAVEHVQTVYSCRTCEQSAVDNPVPMVKSKVPAPVIPGSGVASPSLLSYIICNKYVLALPLYRQEQEFERLGLTISRQTMANWIIYVAAHWLKPIFELLRTELLLNDILHADETTVQVIKEDGRTAKQESYMWLYRTATDVSRPAVLFEYQPTRSSSHPIRFLADYKGYLHVDGYQGYKKLEAPGVTIVECWAHMRRKFHDALKALEKADRANSPANVGYEFCNRLFELERKYNEDGLTPEQRHGRRVLESRPIALEFFEWAMSQSAKSTTLAKSAFGKAVGYAVNQQKWLMNIYLDGRLAISNNLAETSIRPFAIGRNNWLFSYSANGAASSAIVYSIVETAKANDLVPFLYFKYLLENLPHNGNQRLYEFLPWTSTVQELCKKPI